MLFSICYIGQSLLLNPELIDSARLGVHQASGTDLSLSPNLSTGLQALGLVFTYMLRIKLRAPCLHSSLFIDRPSPAPSPRGSFSCDVTWRWLASENGFCLPSQCPRQWWFLGHTPCKQTLPEGCGRAEETPGGSWTKRIVRFKNLPKCAFIIAGSWGFTMATVTSEVTYQSHSDPGIS